MLSVVLQRMSNISKFVLPLFALAVIFRLAPYCTKTGIQTRIIPLNVIAIMCPTRPLSDLEGSVMEAPR